MDDSKRVADFDCYASPPPTKFCARADGVPESVDKLTIAVDSWGTNDLNPWALTSVSFLGDYYNLRLMMQAPNGDLAAAWATEVNQTEEGLTFKINPKATFADGTPADAEAVKQNLEGFMGKYVEQAGYEAPLWNSAKANEFIDSVEVLSPTEVFVKTKGPKPPFMWNLGGNGYHLYWYGNPTRLLQGPKAYLEDAAGGGPYVIKKWDAGNRIVFERREDFWGGLSPLAQTSSQDHGNFDRQRPGCAVRAAQEPADGYRL